MDDYKKSGSCCYLKCVYSVYSKFSVDPIGRAV